MFLHGHQLTIALDMTDEDVVRQAALIAGVGNVRGPYTNKGGLNKKPVWQWTVTTNGHAYALMVALCQWLCSRRRAKVLECLSMYMNRQRELDAGRWHLKMTPAAIKDVRSAFNGYRFAAGENAKLAEKYGVSKGMISYAARGHH
jgi:hypothetical protein